MSEFKVGDRVRTTSRGMFKSAQIGDIGKAVRVPEHGGAWVRFDDGRELYFYGREIELADTFTINSGDYIDSRKFNREECERFCKLAVECGFGSGEWLHWYGDKNVNRIGVDRTTNSVYWGDTDYYLQNSITTQFREFLDKEKGMKQDKDLQSFVKDDLKDGMRAKYRNGARPIVIKDRLYKYHESTTKLTFAAHLSDYNQDLTWKHGNNEWDIMELTDRDGTVVFKREEETIITMQDVADKFGVPLNQLKIKGE